MDILRITATAPGNFGTNAVNVGTVAVNIITAYLVRGIRLFIAVRNAPLRAKIKILALKIPDILLSEAVLRIYDPVVISLTTAVYILPVVFLAGNQAHSLAYSPHFIVSSGVWVISVSFREIVGFRGVLPACELFRGVQLVI